MKENPLHILHTLQHFFIFLSQKKIKIQNLNIIPYLSIYLYSCQLKAVVYSNNFFDVFQFATISYPTISFHSIIILGSGSHLGSVCIKINTKSIISLKRRKKSIPIKLTLSQKWNLKRKQNKNSRLRKLGLSNTT